MSESASKAVSSSSAATAATGSPTYRTLSTASAVSSCVDGMIPIFSGMSAPVTIATTPGCASARDTSIPRIRACASFGEHGGLGDHGAAGAAHEIAHRGERAARRDDVVDDGHALPAAKVAVLRVEVDRPRVAGGDRLDLRFEGLAHVRHVRLPKHD